MCSLISVTFFEQMLNHKPSQEQLEISKKAAEAANESKTLFIANISHELKTPLNGILGMCAVCLGEDDLPRIKRSLQVIYKSGVRNFQSTPFTFLVGFCDFGFVPTKPT